MDWKPRGKPRKYAIDVIELKEGIKIGIFQGSKGENPDLDFVVKYKDPKHSNRLRTPQHIHWVIDLLIKKQHNKELTMDFIKYLRKKWDNMEALKNKEDQKNVRERLTSKEELEGKFGELNNYGEFSVEFIAYIIELFVIEEKTGLEGAFMFKDLFDALLEEKDIFSVVSTATYH
ncbi:MAG: hypothetical protein ACOCRX_07295 [Candidatus Woesearchaeota archaeon]